MATKIKNIGKFSLDAIQVCVSRLTDDEKATLDRLLAGVEKDLKGKCKKEQKDKKISKKQDKAARFQALVKTMEEELNAFKRRKDIDGDELSHIGELPENCDFGPMTLDQLRRVHTEILKIENDIEIYHNICHFLR